MDDSYRVFVVVDNEPNLIGVFDSVEQAREEAARVGPGAVILGPLPRVEPDADS